MNNSLLAWPLEVIGIGSRLGLSLFYMYSAGKKLKDGVSAGQLDFNYFEKSRRFY